MVDLNLASRHLTVPLLSLCTWILSSSYVSVSRACQRLPVWLCVVFSPYFLRAPEVEEFKREKPTSHTHLSFNTFLVQPRKTLGPPRHRDFSSFVPILKKPCLVPASCVGSLSRISTSCVTRIEITSGKTESEVTTRSVFFSYPSYACVCGFWELQRRRKPQHDHYPCGKKKDS